jgi:hypothetical protein
MQSTAGKHCIRRHKDFNSNSVKNAVCTVTAYIMAGRRLVLLVLVLAVLACAAEARHGRRLRSGSNRRTNFDFFFLVRCV